MNKVYDHIVRTLGCLQEELPVESKWIPCQIGISSRKMCPFPPSSPSCRRIPQKSCIKPCQKQFRESSYILTCSLQWKLGTELCLVNPSCRNWRFKTKGTSIKQMFSKEKGFCIGNLHFLDFPCAPFGSSEKCTDRYQKNELLKP